MGASAATAANSNVSAPNSTLNPPLASADDEKRSLLRYVLGVLCVGGFIFAFYHAGSGQKGAPSALAGILAPAAIMISYLVWVLYSTRVNRQRTARLAALALATSNAEAAADRSRGSMHTTVSLGSEAGGSRHSSPGREPPAAPPKSLKGSAVPARMHHASHPLHRSSDNLHRGGAMEGNGARAYNPLEPSGVVGVHGRGRSGTLGRSTLHLNNTRHLATAVANLPSYKDATNRNNWLLKDNSRSQETLLRK